jgi:3' terminal RNA ribose 2'-O-methyltransferase Hen1
MLLTISTSHRPATDLGYLLHKNPENIHRANVPFGEVTMFYPEASEARCTFALTLEIDPVGLVRGNGLRSTGIIDQYVNDRPYAASSFLSVAIGRALGTAFAGRSKDRQQLADSRIPFEATVIPLPCRGGAGVVRRLFEPLGYTVETEEHQLDPRQPDLGQSNYVSLKLSGEVRLQQLLQHLFVLIPVLDDRKHYYVGTDELEKLLRKGDEWLKAHPEKELITTRYLKHRRNLAREALARLADSDTDDESLDPPTLDKTEEALEKPIRLHDLRLDTVCRILVEAGAKRVLDLGCGEGKLIGRLLKEKQIEEIVGVDISCRMLEIAENKLKIDRMTERQRQRIRLMQGALTYRDTRFSDFDAISLVEVIEHLELDRLPSLVRTVFEFSRPNCVVVTTPNRDYNAKFDNLPEGKFRHPDHRFEWDQKEFKDWAKTSAAAHGYSVNVAPLGEIDPKFGAPSQIGVFTR